MTEQRSGQQWIIKVNGAEQTDVKPGESIEIGRKPLRPLADDGNRRLEVPDSERSMSKRHALFTVHEDGSADVRDLNSTNGTYLNGRRIERKERLFTGDIIGIGSEDIVFTSQMLQ